MNESDNSANSGIRDNLECGSVGAFLRDTIDEDSRLSIVSAYFTIYAYAALKEKLDSIAELRFLFGEPRFISSVDSDKSDGRAFEIVEDGLELSNRLEQKRIARECAAWIREKVQIRSIRQASLLHGKMYHIETTREPHAILGSSNFTVSGLGLSPNGRNNIELNLIVDSRRDR